MRRFRFPMSIVAIGVGVVLAAAPAALAAAGGRPFTAATPANVDIREGRIQC